MPEQFLNRHQIRASAVEAGCESVTKGMPGNVIKTGFAAGLLQTEPEILPLAAGLGVKENVLALADAMPAAKHTQSGLVYGQVEHPAVLLH